MRLKTMLAIAVTGAFSLPMAASAGDASLILAQAGGPSGSSAVGTGPAGAPASPQSAGQPKASEGHSGMSGALPQPGFSMLDKNNDGQISRAEWDDHQRMHGGSASGGATMAPGGSGSTTGATAGPGSASNQTAPSSATATSPSTSGHGTAK